MKFLGDMGISIRTIAWLRNSGYDAVHLRELGLQQATDLFIMKKASKEGRVVLTMDLDFGYLHALGQERTPSVIIFRLKDERSENVNRCLEMALKKGKDDLKKGAIISVSEKTVRVRILPIGSN